MTPAQLAAFEKGPCPLCGRPKDPRHLAAYFRESAHPCAKDYHDAVRRFAAKDR